jgi:hypothetical protein
LSDDESSDDESLDDALSDDGFFDDGFFDGNFFDDALLELSDSQPLYDELDGALSLASTTPAAAIHAGGTSASPIQPDFLMSLPRSRRSISTVYGD